MDALPWATADTQKLKLTSNSKNELFVQAFWINSCPDLTRVSSRIPRLSRLEFPGTMFCIRTAIWDMARRSKQWHFPFWKWCSTCNGNIWASKVKGLADVQLYCVGRVIWVDKSYINILSKSINTGLTSLYKQLVIGCSMSNPHTSWLYLWFFQL